MPTKSKRSIITTMEQGEQSFVYQFTKEEKRNCIATLKNNKAAGLDDVLVEQRIYVGPRAHRRLRSMLNTCFIENKIPKVWRQSRIIAILQPVTASIPKSYRPNSLLCHTYKLYESHIIKEQAGFRRRKSYTSQLQNLIEHIEDGSHCMITEAAFVDLSAAYDTGKTGLNCQSP